MNKFAFREAEDSDLRNSFISSNYKLKQSALSVVVTLVSREFSDDKRTRIQHCVYVCVVKFLIRFFNFIFQLELEIK